MMAPRGSLHRNSHLARTSAATFACVALAGGAVAAIGFTNTDHVLEKSFTVAMAGGLPDGAAARVNSQRAATTRPGAAMISGSEDFWLGRLPGGASPASWSAPLAAGDHFAMGAEGAERRFTVVSVRETTLATDGKGKAARLLFVECREDGVGTAAPIVHIVMDDALAASLKAGAALPRTL